MPYKDPQSAAAKATDKRKRVKYRLTHPQKELRRYRNVRYKREHGITLDEFEQRIAKQNNMCPIGSHQFSTGSHKGDSPCMDHDHETGELRMVLCNNHNAALGMFHDSVDELLSAVKYLNQFKGDSCLSKY